MYARTWNRHARRSRLTVKTRTPTWDSSARHAIPFSVTAAYVRAGSAGPNAQDSRLARSMGILIARDPESHVVIVSRAADVDPLIRHRQTTKPAAS